MCSWGGRGAVRDLEIQEGLEKPPGEFWMSRRFWKDSQESFGGPGGFGETCRKVFEVQEGLEKNPGQFWRSGSFWRDLQEDFGGPGPFVLGAELWDEMLLMHGDRAGDSQH